jgi:uncharacterized NAD-dependent epimerase/dehydratase family protein
VRHRREFAVGNGVKRPGKRLLTVGTDCSIGKMFTALRGDARAWAEAVPRDQTGIFTLGMAVDRRGRRISSRVGRMAEPVQRPDHWI